MKRLFARDSDKKLKKLFANKVIINKVNIIYIENYLS